ncbi:hypothetical protein [Kineococcus sp. SYSU DK018]|uniref:hypothetical protein n=1 Tax=Kineococcus sp. SYSU DK018 TaxID=3383139 RepID=UPI003D7CF7BD
MPRYSVLIEATRPKRVPPSADLWKQQWGEGHHFAVFSAHNVVQAVTTRAEDARTARDDVLARFTALAQAHLGTGVQITNVRMRRLRRFRGSVPVSIDDPPDGEDGLAGAVVPRTPLPPTGHLHAARRPPPATD